MEVDGSVFAHQRRLFEMLFVAESIGQCVQRPFDVFTSAQAAHLIVVAIAVVVERFLPADGDAVAGTALRVENLKVGPDGMLAGIGELKLLLLAILLAQFNLPIAEAEFFGLAVITYFLFFFRFLFLLLFFGH